MVISKNSQTPTTQIVLDREQQSWWNSLSDGQRKTIVSFAIALGISIVAFIAIKFASNKIRNVIANNAESNSFGESNHATWAKQLKMAFDNDGWWGTDEASIRRVLLSVPSKEDFTRVQSQYRKLYKVTRNFSAKDISICWAAVYQYRNRRNEKKIQNNIRHRSLYGHPC